MSAPEIATVRALRSDVALQIARHIKRSNQSQVDAARQLGVPQPTLSKIMRNQVETLSLELLLRIAVRARLSVILQTGNDPAEAGAYVSGVEVAEPLRQKSRVAEAAREELLDSARRLSPEQRLEAHLRHSELVTSLNAVGRKGPVAARRKGETGR